MSLLIHKQIFKQDINKLKPFLKSKLKEKSIYRENGLDTIDDQFEFFKTYYLGNKNTQNNFIDKDLLSELISQESNYNKNILNKKTNNFLELFLPNEDFDLDIDIDNNKKQEAMIFFYNNDNKMLREICTEFDLNTNDFIFKTIKEKKIRTKFEVQNMKLIQNNFPENKNFLLFNDMYNIYKLNIKAIHDNLQENITKISTIEEIPISFISDLYIDKIFTISSDDDFIKQDFSKSNIDKNNNQQINFLNETNNNISSSHNKLSLIDFNTGSIMTEYNLTSANNNNIYKSGHFLNNSNIILINSKNMISLIDFRYKEYKLNDLLPDYNFNFNEVIILDSFQYMTLSPHKISLFDLRYPSLPKTEKVLNINYRELSIKKNKNKDFSYILFDKYKNDTSFIKLDLNQKSLKSSKIMENFAEFHLLNNNNNSQIFVHDIVGFIHQEEEEDDFEEKEINNENESLNSISFEYEENKMNKDNNVVLDYNNINETYFCFILDNFNGLYMNIYDINNNISLNNEENDEDINDNNIKNNTYYDQLFNLYLRYYKDLAYISTDEENNLYNFNKDDTEDKQKFGYIKLNEKDKKMYEIDSKRNIFEEVLKAYNSKDKNISMNFNILSQKIKETLIEDNSRKVSVNSIDSDISVNELPVITKEEYEKIKDIIDKFNLEEKEEKKE